MGAKQSKRSVDISGKEAEGASEVAAAGAGGEGRLEALADADSLKPQLNGDTPHIQPLEEQPDKEKQLDSGTPENEKDATTEKEATEQAKEDKDKEAIPVTNGESEPEELNGEATPAPDSETKKPKKEKVKKKWSLRSISFSRKDKPKQEKKPKEEKPKTNGDMGKVLKETAEAVDEIIDNKVTEDATTEAEAKEDKIAETPVTEPITNGTGAPESPKEAPAAVEAPVAEADRLPLNGLSLEDKPEVPAVEPAAPAAETAAPAAETAAPAAAAPEPVPAPEIPVKAEVCVERVPLVESTPPPLPANPPPSSVASFAATTMAPETTHASLSHVALGHTLQPAERLPIPPPAPVEPQAPLPAELEVPPPVESAEIPSPPVKIAEIPSPPVECTDIPPPTVEAEISSPPVECAEIPPPPVEAEIPSPPVECVEITSPVVGNETPSPPTESVESLPPPPTESDEAPLQAELDMPFPTDIDTTPPAEVDAPVPVEVETPLPVDVDTPSAAYSVQTPPPPPAQIDTREDSLPEPDFKMKKPVEAVAPQEFTGDSNTQEKKTEDRTETEKQEKTIVNSNHNSDTIELNGIDNEKLNGNADETEKENLKNKAKDSDGNVPESECNGNAESPQPPSAPLADTPQDVLQVHDKIADLIPEVPDLPTETPLDTASDVAQAY